MRNFKVLLPLLAVLAAFYGLTTYRTVFAEEIPYTIVENHTELAVDHEKVEKLFLEVAAILGITVNQEFIPPRIFIIAKEDLQNLYEKSDAFIANHDSTGLYLPKSNHAILITSTNLFTLGHEFAHYFTNLYLRAPREKWEKIARHVELELAIRHPLQRR